MGHMTDHEESMYPIGDRGAELFRRLGIPVQVYASQGAVGGAPEWAARIYGALPGRQDLELEVLAAARDDVCLRKALLALQAMHGAGFGVVLRATDNMESWGEKIRALVRELRGDRA